MFGDKSRDFDRALLMLDIIAGIAAFLIAYRLTIILTPNSRVYLFSHISLLPMIIALQLFHLSYFKAYQSPRQTSMVQYCWLISKSVAVTVAALIAILSIMNIQYVSRFVVVIFAGLVFILLVGMRFFLVLYFRKSLKRGHNIHSVLIIGTGSRAVQLSSLLRDNADWGIDIIGHLDPEKDLAGTNVLGSPVLGAVDDISNVLKQHIVDEVIIAIPRTLIGDVEQIAHACEEEGIKLRIMADLYDLEVTRVSLLTVEGVPLLTLEPVALDEGKLILKRIFDLAAVILSIPVILPLMGIIALMIKFDSPGPVFFIQERIGLRKRRFNMLKFRSMYEGSEKRLEELEGFNEAEGPIFKMANDPRVTRVGKFIRRTSMDELPQLFNVLAGTMSLVGPRPMSVRDVDLFDRGIQRKRFSVKPGLTCLWQISGRSNLPFSKWLELDLKYIENWSLLLDFKILFKTIPVVFRGHGAM